MAANIAQMQQAASKVFRLKALVRLRPFINQTAKAPSRVRGPVRRPMVPPA